MDGTVRAMWFLYACNLTVCDRTAVRFFPVGHIFRAVTWCDALPVTTRNLARALRYSYVPALRRDQQKYIHNGPSLSRLCKYILLFHLMVARIRFYRTQSSRKAFFTPGRDSSRLARRQLLWPWPSAGHHRIPLPRL